MRKPRLLFLSMLVSSGPSERQADAGSTLESALVEHLGCDHVVDGDTHVHREDALAVALASGLEARGQIAEIGADGRGDAAEVHAVPFGREQLTDVVGAEPVSYTHLTL